MARTGQASIEVVADFGRFAANFQRELTSALRGINVDMSRISNQLSAGARAGTQSACQEFQRLGQCVNNSMSAIASSAAGTSRSIGETFANAGRSMSAVGDQMTMAVTVPLAAAGTLTVQAAASFEKAMNKVRAATEASGKEFADLRKLAIDLGSTTAFSASEAAYAMNELATAGFDTKAIMGALPGVLDMAAAGSVGLAEAAEISAAILNGFGFEATDLAMVNDVLARDFLSTATALNDLGEAFKYVGPTAKAAGLTFTETAAALGLMGNAGIRGSMAGTGLNTSIARLLKPTKAVSEVMSRLGMVVTDSSGKLLPLVTILKQLEKGGATTADMMKLFGLEAGPKMQALLTQGSAALSALDHELQNAGGTASRVAKIQMEGLSGSMDELSSSAEGLMIAIGDAGLLRWVTALVEKLTGLVMSMSKLSPTFLRVATIIGIVVASIGPILAIFGRLVTAIGEGILALQRFGSWALRVAPWLSSLTGPIGWVIAGIAALVVGLIIAYKKSEAFRNVVDSAFRAVASAAIWLWQSAIVPAFNGIVNAVKAVGSGIARLWQQAQPVFAAIGAVVMRIWSSAIKPALTSMGTSMMAAGSALAGFWSGTARPALMGLMGLFTRLGNAVRGWWSGNGDSVMSSAAAAITRFGGIATQVWSGFMAVLKAVVSVVTWAIVNVVIPVFKVTIDVLRTIISAVLSAKSVWTVVFSVIGAVVSGVVWVVKAFWAVVTTAFTAVAAIVKWLWSTILVPAFAAMGAVIKAFIAVVVWMWSSVFQPVFTALVSAVNAVASALLWLWSSVFSPVFNAIGAVLSWVWSSIIMPVFNAIKIAIGAVVAAGLWFWETFGPLFTAIGNLLWTIWSGIISIVFGLLKLAFAGLVAAAQLLWAVIQPVLSAIGALFSWLWTSAVQPALSAIGALFSWLWTSAVQPALSAIGALFSWLWTSAVQPALSAIGALFTWLWTSAVQPALSAIGAMFTWLWNGIKAVFDMTVQIVQAAIAAIVAAANGITGFVNSVSQHFQNMVNAVRARIDAAVSFVRGLPGQIIGAVGNLGSLLYNAGQNVISGLINGISSRIAALRAKISEAASTIRNALPFSPAKEGPLSGRGDPTIAGAKIVHMIAAGMETGVPQLRQASWGMADAAVTAPAGGLAGGLQPLVANRGQGLSIVFGSNSINVTFSGVVPTAGEAKDTGYAVGDGIIAALTRAKTSSLVRSI